MPFNSHLTCPSFLESTLVSAFNRELIPDPSQPIGPVLSWEWTAAMTAFICWCLQQHVIFVAVATTCDIISYHYCTLLLVVQPKAFHLYLMLLR